MSSNISSTRMGAPPYSWVTMTSSPSLTWEGRMRRQKRRSCTRVCQANSNAEHFAVVGGMPTCKLPELDARWRGCNPYLVLHHMCMSNAGHVMRHVKPEKGVSCAAVLDSCSHALHYHLLDRPGATSRKKPITHAAAHSQWCHLAA